MDRQRLYFILLCFLGFCSCSTVSHKGEEKISHELLRLDDNIPKYVAVLPFLNNTKREALEIDVRRSFYNQFSSKNYYDFELHEVDTSITSLEKIYDKPWRDIPAEDIGKFFNADYLIYGEVVDYKRFFGIIYSQVMLVLNIKMVETTVGEVVWEKTIVKRSHEGDVPITLVAAIMASVRSGLHMKKERSEDVIDSTCRAVVFEMPDPVVSSQPNEGVHLFDLQVASFQDVSRAEDIVKILTLRGYSPRIEKVVLNNVLWHRVLLGPYRPVEAKSAARGFENDFDTKPFMVRHTRKIAVR